MTALSEEKFFMCSRGQLADSDCTGHTAYLETDAEAGTVKVVVDGAMKHIFDREEFDVIVELGRKGISRSSSVGRASVS